MKLLMVVVSMLPLMWALEPGDLSKLDAGVYASTAGKIVPVTPENVEWKNGSGVMHIASAGIIRRDPSAHLNGAHSGNLVGPRTELVVVVPEGGDIHRYQILRMKAGDGSREFHASRGAMWSAADFVLPGGSTRTFTLSLDLLANGEYGLLPPGSAAGKIYSFRIVNSEVQTVRRTSHDGLLHDLAWPGH